MNDLLEEQEKIEYQDVIDALNGIRTFIPGTHIFQRWVTPEGRRFQVRFKVVSRTAKTVNLEQMPAQGEYEFAESYARPFRARVRISRRSKCEFSNTHALFASNRC